MAQLKQKREFGKTKMSKSSEKYILIFSILAFAFVYRMLLIQHAAFAPGADIGLHNSVLHSITSSGSVDFYWNFYQMGGGLSLTFPGYHIFVAALIFMTGLPDFLCHSLVVAFLSTMTVACSFLLTRRIWAESTAFIVAFLTAVSRFDIEMLMWGGFPNVASLMLIPLIFYLLLQKERFTLFPFLLSTSLLSSAIFLTHSLSAAMLLGITLLTIVSAIVLSNQLSVSKKSIVVWILPLVLGAAVSLPLLLSGVNAYVENQAIIAVGPPDIRQALLSTRILPLELVVPLFVCVSFFFLFSKENKGRYLTLPVLLLALWVLVPMFFTQSYLVGQYTDYNRFLYFVLTPVIMLLGLGIDHVAGFFTRIAGIYQLFKGNAVQHGNHAGKAWLQLQRQLTPKNVYSFLILAFLLIAFLFIPVFITPFQGVEVQGFYQVMTDSGYEATRWARENTEGGSVFVSDALYGWWFSGFALRRTLSAVPPQYLSLGRELAPAQNATYLLDTNYMIDNGLIQVREDGAYIGRHNPLFLAKLNWSYFPYPFFHFNNDETLVVLEDGTGEKFFTLDKLRVIEMKFENTSDQAVISIKKGNDLFNYTQILTGYKSRQFVNMSIMVQSGTEVISLKSLHTILHIRGVPIIKNETVGVFEDGSKVLGQLIYVEKQPELVKTITPDNPSALEFVYDLQGHSSAELQLFVSAFSVSDKRALYENMPPQENSYLNNLLDSYVQSYLGLVQITSEDLCLDFFDYRKAIVDWNVSYIACRDAAILPKFASDPTFSRVFINHDVAIFKVNSNSK